jgi:hypothetical protein
MQDQGTVHATTEVSKQDHPHWGGTLVQEDSCAGGAGTKAPAMPQQWCKNGPISTPDRP